MSSTEDLVSKASAVAKNCQVDEIDNLANAWKKFDVNGDEVIKAEEVEQFLADLNINMPAEAREEFVATLDKNGDGTIAFIEFVIAYNNGTFKEFMG